MSKDEVLDTLSIHVSYILMVTGVSNCVLQTIIVFLISCGCPTGPEIAEREVQVELDS